MNNIKNNLVRIFIAVVFVFSFTVMTAQPPPPPGGNSGGSGGPQNQRLRANIGGGVLILLALGLAYGGKKIYTVMKEKKEELA